MRGLGALSRRKFLNGTLLSALGLAAASAAPLPYYLFRPRKKNIPDDTLMFGLNLLKDGMSEEEIREQIQAYALAIQHINEGGGMLRTITPSVLTGNGLLGKKVEYVMAESTLSDIRTNFQHLIDKNNAVLLCGGLGTDAYLAQQDLATANKRLFMGGLIHSSLFEEQRGEFSFRHFFNCRQGAQALCPFLARTYGNRRSAFHVTSNYPWSWDTHRAMSDGLAKEGWGNLNNFVAPYEAEDYAPAIKSILESSANVVVLNLYGEALKKALRQITDSGLREKVVNGMKMEIVIPLFTETLAKNIGFEYFEGIYTPMNWHASLKDEGSLAFSEAYKKRYNMEPTQNAHTIYVQTLAFATAVEATGSVEAHGVVKYLEDANFEGLGGGKVWYRGDDHQAFHNLYIAEVRRKKSTSNLEMTVVHQVAGSELLYGNSLRMPRG